MKKWHIALFRVDLFTLYFRIAFTVGHGGANQRVTTEFSTRALARRKFCGVQGIVDTGTGTVCKPVVRHYLTLDTPVSGIARHYPTLDTPVSDRIVVPTTSQ